jgi:ferredoxin
MTERWSVRVDRGVCIGSGMCVGAAPEEFAFDEQQRSRPLSESIDPDAAVRDAAASCPVEAISLTGADSGDPVGLD